MRLLAERAKAGVEIRIIGKLEKSVDGHRGAQARRPAAARARDRPRRHGGVRRQPEPAQAGARRAPRGRRDHHRPRIAKKMQAVFEADWAQTPGVEAEAKAEKGRSDEKDEGALLLLPARDHAGVDDLPGRDDRVEVHLVAVDLRHHERLVAVEARSR